MATPSDRLPFVLTFLQFDHRIPVFEFDRGQLERTEPVIEIKENIELRVLFESDDPDARFYMEGLEVLSEKVVDVDENRTAYLVPSEESYLIFTNSKVGEYYPLIPGNYRIRVITGEGSYHSLMRVVPKQMKFEQWEVMRNELEEQLRGLAQDLIRRDLGVGEQNLNILPPEQLRRFAVIKKHFVSVMVALNDLLTKVNYRIRKDYRIVPVDRAKAVDQVTVRHRLTHPEITQMLKTPVREVDYDLPENQWVCRIVKYVSNMLEEISGSLEAYLAAEEVKRAFEAVTEGHELYLEPVHVREMRSKAMNEMWEVAAKMKHSLGMIKSARWYDEITQNVYSPIPNVLMFDSRYRALYQLYRELRGDQVEIGFDAAYTSQWKQTSQLYEIWGFLQLCKVLTDKLGYQARSGWLFDTHFDGSLLLIPTLNPNTTIVLEQGDLRLHLTYDQIIPPKSEERSSDILSMSGNFHNRPDARLDIFKGNIYAGSLVFDFKYRPLHRFWNIKERSASRRPVSTNQLIAYHSDSKSKKLFGNLITEENRNQLRPVFEVWGIYPTDNRTDPVEYDDQHNVRLIRICPGENNDHVEHEMSASIQRVLKFLEYYA